MSRGLNKVQLIGNLGDSPVMRETKSGTPVANLSVATNQVIPNGNGGRDHTEWHRVVAFGRLAEVMGEYLDKGSRIFVEGELRTESWEDDDGHTRYTTRIRANELVMLDGRRSEPESEAT